MVILSQDPSFSGLGFSLYREDKNTIYVRKCSIGLGNSVGFEVVFNKSIEHSDNYISIIDSLLVGSKIDYVISEIPPPSGTYSAGLFALDTLLLYRIKWLYNPKEMVTLNPSFLVKIHNTRKYTKKDSITLTNYLMDILKDDFTFNIIRDGIKGANAFKLDDNMAESLLFMFRAFVRYDVKGVGKKIVDAITGFFDESEKVLFREEKI